MCHRFFTNTLSSFADFVNLSSSGIRTLNRAELLDVATFAMMSKIRASMHRICWECHAPLSLDATVCEEHQAIAADICASCDQRYRATVDVSCSSCGTSGFGPLVEYAIISAPVSNFFGHRGLAPCGLGPWRYRLTALGSASETVLTTDPLTVEFEFLSSEDTFDITIKKDDSQIALDNV